jgi:hypothetical protein
MGVPNSEVGYTSATTERGDHEVHKGHLVALTQYIYIHFNIILSSSPLSCLPQIFQTELSMVCSESLCALMKGVGSDVHERRHMPELNVRTVAQVHSDFPNVLYFRPLYTASITTRKTVV